MDRLNEIDRQLAEIEKRRPLFPRAWKEDVEQRMALTGRSIDEVVLDLREERNLIPPGPVTPSALLEHERRFLELFEPDELLAEDAPLPAAATGD